ncbi:MAG: hypothetical protein JKY66_07070, partial [Spongiibacteraceae bacterium]|nr:hypothetical protein [Spongiibacteraceae bacterium]
DAIDDAVDAFTRNASTGENSEIMAAYNANHIAVEVEFSSTLAPFVVGSVPEMFVRVRVEGLSLTPWLIQVTGFNNKRVGATAVSGPSPTLTNNICTIAPVMMCGEADTDPYDDYIYGYHTNEAVVLKHGSNQESEVGMGNFQLIRIGGNGGAVIRQGAAGAYGPESCLSIGDSVDTEPGNTVGPVVQGFNTRFGQYQGPLSESDYPPDFITNAPDPSLRLDGDGNIEFTDGSAYTGLADMSFSHTHYNAAYSDVANGFDSQSSAVNYHRRIITVPVGNCTGTTHGQGQVSIYGFVCVYLVQPVVQQGNEAHVFGQIVEGCNTAGTFSIDPVTGPQPTKIILYKDPTGIDA